MSIRYPKKERQIRFIAANTSNPRPHIHGPYESRVFLDGYLTGLGLRHTKVVSKDRAIYIPQLNAYEIERLVDWYNLHVLGDDDGLEGFADYILRKKG